MSSGFIESFLGALQASLSILLVIFYGVLASQFKLLDGKASKKISTVCVKLFLPMLLITKVGSELHQDTGVRYIPILIWSILYSTISIGIGLVAEKVFKFPQWVAPALAFNNTTSLPLLLVKSLTSTGILEQLLGSNESIDKAVNRAQSYFLVCAIVGNCMTFAIGPRLIDAEHAPDDHADDDKQAEQTGGHDENQPNGHATHNGEEPDEVTTLLPNVIRGAEDRAESVAYRRGKRRWDTFSPRTQTILSFLYDFCNAPLIGAVIGAIIGLTPPLHRAFFNDSFEGGIFTAWLTSSMQSAGDLFVSLQVVVVGVSLASSLRKMKRGEAGGQLPWKAATFVLIIRFVVWPVVSIPVIWLLATKTHVLDQDPVLWFTMMLMPTGPPAMKLIAMADVTGADEGEKMSIAKLLTLSYALSPVLALTVVGALKTSETAARN